MRFPAEKVHNPPPEKTQLICDNPIRFVTLTSVTSRPVLSQFHHRRPLKDAGPEHQAAPARGAVEGQVNGGRVSPPPVSHLISGLLCSGPLCSGHMYRTQRRGEVDGPLCRGASVTSPVTMQGNDQPASGTE